MLKKLYRKYGPNPLDRLLAKARHRKQVSFLLFWNRGLGDIALGLYAIVHQIRKFVPGARITFLTRPNLHDGFLLLKDVDILVAPNLKRGDKVNVHALLREIGSDPDQFDLILENPDPTHWVSWQHGKLTPILHWQEKWDELWKKFDLGEGPYVGAHVQTESGYASWRDWPMDSWRALFEKCASEGKKVILFGFEQEPKFDIPGVVDLRGIGPYCQ